MLESTEKGSVRNSIRNCLTVFQNDPLLSGAIAKNLLTERVDIVKPIGYHRIGTAITDTDMNYLLLYLEETYGLPVRKRLPPPSGLLPMKTATTRPDYLNGLHGMGRSVSAIACATFWEPTPTSTPMKPCGCSCWEPSTGHFAPAVNLKSCSVWWAVREPGNPPFSGCWQ